MRFRCALVFAATLAASACSSVTAPSENKTETFSGTLEPKGIKFHAFSAANSGEVEVRITALAPVTNVFLGTFIGQPQSDGACGFNQFQQPNEFSTLNIVAISAPIQKGAWCVGIYDPLPGHLTTAATYTLTVKHP